MRISLITALKGVNYKLLISKSFLLLKALGVSDSTFREVIMFPNVGIVV